MVQSLAQNWLVIAQFSHNTVCAHIVSRDIQTSARIACTSFPSGIDTAASPAVNNLDTCFLSTAIATSAFPGALDAMAVIAAHGMCCIAR